MSIATFQNNRPSAQSLKIVNVAFDVGSGSLRWAMQPGRTMITGECENTSNEIRKTLDQIEALARKHGECEVYRIHFATVLQRIWWHRARIYRPYKN